MHVKDTQNGIQPRPSSAAAVTSSGQYVPRRPPDVESARTTQHADVAEKSSQDYTERLGGSVERADDKRETTQTNASNLRYDVASLLPSFRAMKAKHGKEISDTFSAIVDGIPELLDLLDDVANIHPFIKLAVGTFKVVYQLHRRRKDNDQKVCLLFAGMQDMMAILVQLKGIDQHAPGGKDRMTISERMQGLINKAHKEIEDCANSCDAYGKKMLITKVLLSGSWENTFKEHIERFAICRGDFVLALTIHTADGVNIANMKLDISNDELVAIHHMLDTTNGKLDTNDRKLEAIDGKIDTTNGTLVIMQETMDSILLYLKACMSPEERDLATVIREHGGSEAVMQDESLLREVFNTRVSGASISGPGRRWSNGAADKFEELQEELQEDVPATIRENMAQFRGKFAIQEHQLSRIVAEVTSGPHNKILNPVFQEVWKQMHWRWSVNGRDFVLALRDYFSEKIDELKRTNGNATPEVVPPDLRLGEQDEWTLEYMDVSRVQAIIEAFGDAAASSGLVTVSEINAFTARTPPHNWSLPRWLAYWAVGYQMTMSKNVQKIDTILAKMFALKRDVLAPNRNAVEQYLHYVWTAVTTLTAAFRGVAIDRGLLRHFQDYTRASKQHLKEDLETVRYDIDAEDTLALICGPDPIEKRVFPLLYLLLKRDFRIMRLACKECLHVDELEDSMGTIMLVIGAVVKRHEFLVDFFKRQRLDPSQQFRFFAFEMASGSFKYLQDPDEIWSLQKLKDATFLKIPYDKKMKAQSVDSKRILNYPLQTATEELIAAKPIEECVTSDADPFIQKILGSWSGFCAEGDLYPSRPMLCLDLRTSPNDPKRFQCKGVAVNGTSWNLSGGYTVSADGKEVSYTFRITYETRYAPQEFSGKLDKSGTTISGLWAKGDGNDKSSSESFLFKRLSPEIMRFYPAPTALADNKLKLRALWRFAIFAVRDQVLRKRNSWRWFLKRWETGKRYVQLVIRRETSELSTQETIDLANCQRNMTFQQAKLFNILIDVCERSIPIHWQVSIFAEALFTGLTAAGATHRGVFCDGCGDSNIRGNRILCISCGTKHSVDLCDKERCLKLVVGLELHDDSPFPHLPSHDILKLRTAIHPYREFGEVYRAAQSALKTVRRIFVHAATQGEQGEVKQPPRCVNCHQPVSLPCWYCIQCKEEIFVCISCDAANKSGIDVGNHHANHALVQSHYNNPFNRDAEHHADVEHAEPHADAEHGEPHAPKEVTSPDWRAQYTNDFLLHPGKAVHALGAATAGMVQGCVHA